MKAKVIDLYRHIETKEVAALIELIEGSYVFRFFVSKSNTVVATEENKFWYMDRESPRVKETLELMYILKTRKGTNKVFGVALAEYLLQE